MSGQKRLNPLAMSIQGVQQVQIKIQDRRKRRSLDLMQIPSDQVSGSVRLSPTLPPNAALRRPGAPGQGPRCCQDLNLRPLGGSGRFPVSADRLRELADSLVFTGNQAVRLVRVYRVGGGPWRVIEMGSRWSGEGCPGSKHKLEELHAKAA